MSAREPAGPAEDGMVVAGEPGGPLEPAGRHTTAVDYSDPNLTLDAAGQSHRLVVMGSFTDGSQRDVTHLSILESSDDSIASVTRGGVVTSHRRGEVFISVRLPAFISGVRVDVVPGQQPPAALAQLRALIARAEAADGALLHRDQGLVGPSSHAGDVTHGPREGLAAHRGRRHGHGDHLRAGRDLAGGVIA